MTALLKFAKRLEIKIAQQKNSTIKLFFEDESLLDAFVKKITESTKKILDDNNIAFSLYAYANNENGKWTWGFDQKSKQFESKIKDILNKDYYSIFNVKMEEREKEVNNMIKKGASGSGKLRVVDFYQNINQL